MKHVAGWPTLLIAIGAALLIGLILIRLAQ